MLWSWVSPLLSPCSKNPGRAPMHKNTHLSLHPFLQLPPDGSGCLTLPSSTLVLRQEDTRRAATPACLPVCPVLHRKEIRNCYACATVRTERSKPGSCFLEASSRCSVRLYTEGGESETGHGFLELAIHFPSLWLLFI